MDTELRLLIKSALPTLASPASKEIIALAKYFLDRKNYKVIAAVLSEKEPSELVAIGIALGEAWKAANEAAFGESERLYSLGISILEKAILLGLESLQ